MAYSDYEHCNGCGAKTFYTGNLDWDVQNVGANECGDNNIASLCPECTKTHEIIVQKRDEKAAR